MVDKFDYYLHVKNNDIEKLKIYLKKTKIDPNIRLNCLCEYDGCNALHIAAKYGHMEMIEYLISIGVKNRYIAKQIACPSSKLKQKIIFEKYEGNYYMPWKYSYLPFHIGIINNHIQVVKYFGNKKIINNMCVTSRWPNYPLTHALENKYDNYKIVEYLIKDLDAKLDIYDNGYSIIHYLFMLEYKKRKIIKYYNKYNLHLFEVNPFIYLLNICIEILNKVDPVQIPKIKILLLNRKKINTDSTLYKCIILSGFQLKNSNRIIDLLTNKNIILNNKSYFTLEKDLYSGEYLVYQVSKILNS